ncbi:MULTISPECIES: DUF5953 family protein [unclassified Myxococcus]|jgi:hypothetical protein|uniref:DUF5953 family protein n=1 Tax=unclassified Myxococcus TaxID=2648731 RepID=UPI001CBF1662|nr:MULTISPECIES: DUF5953 family protein [unclassified Myxococcus]MBZ4394526.1 DUF5953 family protein [Myxococcus sp. AS-1-15]MBZ4409997.1 DUF5953 family protein [Myxococcus sp. XM-1-1-1]BDT36932.1 DUF5953 family protein [Myxococcus sp. MH1]
MTPQSPLVLNVYAPALTGADPRPLATVQGLEHALPGLRLDRTVTESRRLAALPQRDEWLTEAGMRGEFPFVCNGDERHPVIISGRLRSANVSPGRRPQLQVHAKLPLDATVATAASAVLEAVAEGVQAFWGHATPDDATLDIAFQTAPTREGPPAPRRGLPALKLFQHIRLPEIPYHLGWLNYWSADAVRALGFPDPSLDAELLSRARRTESGGWLVQLTETPLDLDSPAHLETLLRTYERFPEIGGRVSR